MKKQEEHAANNIAHAMKERQQADNMTNEDISTTPMQVDADLEEDPPKTGSKQWKAFYRTIADYAKELRENKQ